MERLFTMLGDFLRDRWNAFQGEGRDDDWLPFLRPVPPYRAPGILEALSTMAAFLALVGLTGVSIGALGILALAALGLHLLLTEVFGITIEFRPPPP